LNEDTVRVAMGTVYCEEHLPQAANASPYTAQAVPNPGVSPGLAFLLGLIPGVGAIYNGQYAKGVVHVLIVGLLISIMSSGAAGGLEPLFGMLVSTFFFYMAFEAYHTAKKRMMGEPVDEFSSLIQFRSQGAGAVALPVVLIALGALLLMNNLGWLNMTQVLRFWPVLLIAGGVYMLYLRMKAREEAVPTVEVGRD
jgi:TM2 domain-containing membrane protein YozV